MSESKPDIYISLRAGARKLGISTGRFVKVAAAASIRRLEYPGLSPRYNQTDIEALVKTAVSSEPRVKIGKSA